MYAPRTLVNPSAATGEQRMIKSQADHRFAAVPDHKQVRMTEVRMTETQNPNHVRHFQCRDWNLLVIWCLVLGAFSLAGGGCARKPKPVQLSGKVNFKGQPVPAGYITFMPDVSNGNRGSTKLLRIKDGVYDSSQDPPDQRLTPGAYHLRIAGFDGKVQPRFNQGKQIFNPVAESFVVPDTVSTKDFTIPDSAG